ncbi:MAG: hypothetical protein PHW04_11765 [Candidatus Wallbacteria bacterium]|nr:hypothetical protein [Candidatus Wallbacteria bacterium]
MRIISLVSLILILFNAPGYAATSIMGPTGLINVPSPACLEKGFLEAGMHTRHYSFGSFNGSGMKYSFKGNFGVTENFEVGFEKGVDTGVYLDDPGICVQGKTNYHLGENLMFAAGALIDSDANDYSSAYFTVGAPIAFFGFGFNFGGHENTFNNAAFGGYDFQKGRPEDAFFLAGAEFKLNAASFTIGYNGDYVALGVRAPVQSQQMTVDISWASSGDYVDYYRQVKNSNYDSQHIIIGVSGMF